MDSSFRLALANDEQTIDFKEPNSKLEDMFSEFMHESTVQIQPPVPTPVPAPTTTATSSSSSTLIKTLLAKVVIAYKLLNNENVSQGRVGLAVVQHTADEARIILYRSKLDVLSTYTKCPGASDVTVQGDYIQYRDDTQQFWSVCFLVAAERIEFLQAIASLGTPPESQQQSEAAVVDSAAHGDISPSGEIATTTLPSSDVDVVSSATDRPSIVSRMAKMGHQLPQLDPSAARPGMVVHSTSSSSEPGSPNAITETVVPASFARPQTAWRPSVASRSGSHSQHPAAAVLSANTLIAYNPSLVTASSSAPSLGADASAAAMLAHFGESRMQNTELRMNLTKLEQRIDRVLDKIDTIAVQPSPGVGRMINSSCSASTTSADAEAELIAMEERMLALRKENLAMRRQLHSLATKPTADDSAASMDAVRCECEQLRAANADLTKRVRALETTGADMCRQLAEHDESSDRLEQLELANLDLLNLLNTERLTNKQMQTKLESQTTDDQLAETVRSVLSQFYQEFHAAMNTTEATEVPLTADRVCRLARTLIKNEAQKLNPSKF